MTIWQGGLIVVATLSAFPCLYGLVRLLGWLKQRGWLSWQNERTGSSAMSCFVAMQQFVEPAVKHVHERNRRRDTGSKSTSAGNGPDADGA